MKTIERKEARIQGLKRYYTGKPCKSSHVDERYVANGRCLSCMDKWKEDNRDKVLSIKESWNERNKDYQANYYSENKENVISRVKAYRIKNLEKVKSTKRAYYLKNREYIVERQRINSKAYAKKYPWKQLARTRAYQSAKIERTIPLTDQMKSDILDIYKKASLMRDFGFDCHVDHMIPLRGEMVSGLHVPWNLQIISASENLSKSNKFIPD